jgi:hypothetical protein
LRQFDAGLGIHERPKYALRMKWKTYPDEDKEMDHDPVRVDPWRYYIHYLPDQIILRALQL